MPISEAQRQAAEDYLSRNPKTCGNCGGTDWEFGEIDVYAADASVTPQPIKPGGLTYLRVTCRSCGEEDAIDCAEAGIPDEP